MRKLLSYLCSWGNHIKSIRRNIQVQKNIINWPCETCPRLYSNNCNFSGHLTNWWIIAHLKNSYQNLLCAQHQSSVNALIFTLSNQSNCVITVAIRLPLVKLFLGFLQISRVPYCFLNSDILGFKRKVSWFLDLLPLLYFLYSCHFSLQFLSFQAEGFLFRVYFSLLNSLRMAILKWLPYHFSFLFVSSLSFSSSSSSSVLPPWENS